MSQPRRRLTCWWTEPGSEPGDDPCGAELYVYDGEWHCPHGHRLRQWRGLSARTKAAIAMAQGTPGQLERMFEWRGDRLP